MHLAVGEALLGQPVVVEHLRQVLGAGVAHQRHHPLGFGLLAAVAQGRGQQGARGRATQHAGAAQQLARGLHAFAVRNGIRLFDQGNVAGVGDEVLADALDHPRARGDVLVLVDQRGQDRADRIGQDHLGLGRVLGEVAAEPGQGAARAHADHHGVDVAIHLGQDLGAGGGLVRQRVRRVGELVHIDRVGGVGGQPLGDVLVVFRVALANVGAGQAHVHAQAAQVLDLLARHLVGHHQDQPVALEDAHLGQAQAGVAGGGLDDGAAGLQPAVLLGRLDHGERDAVLDRAARVHVLQLEEQLARPGVEALQFQHRRVADQVERGHDGFGRGGEHELTLMWRGSSTLGARLRLS